MAGLSTQALDEGIASLFQRDTVPLVRYLEPAWRNIHLEREQKLMLAVLEDALTSFQKSIVRRNEKEKRLFREAEEWILLQEKSDRPFSFDNICENVGLNPGYIREGLLRWRYHRLRERDRVRSRVNRRRYASRK
jgi:hypothetical protein